MNDDGNLLIDVAAAPVIYQAEAGTQGGGNILESTNAGFIGTGYVSDAYVSTGSDGRVAPLCR